MCSDYDSEVAELELDSHSIWHRGPDSPKLWVYLVAIVPALLLLIAVGLQPYVDPILLFRDPSVVAFGEAQDGECCKSYYGAISQLGVLIWAGGGCVALFAAIVTYSGRGLLADWLFMATASGITGLLVIDDTFMVHEALYAKLGIPDTATIGVYAALVAGLLWVFRRLIFATAPALLAISLFLFFLSAVLDTFVSKNDDWYGIAEDGSKFVGITTWTTFLFWSAWTLVQHQPSQPRSRPSHDESTTTV